MRTSRIIRTTRASLVATATSHALCYTGAIFGTSLVATQTAKAQSLWEGTTNTDWNEPTNWNPDGVPDGVDATINVKTPNIATISGALSATPNAVIVGRGAGTDGQVNHTAGEVVLGGEVFIGSDNGIGEYNLTGSGSLASSNWINIGGGGPNENTAASSGVFNMNTTGTLTIPGGLAIGRQGTSQAVFNLEAGAVTTGSWTEIGNFGASEGTLNMSGGSLTKSGDGNLEVGTNGATGTVVQTAGDITVSSGQLRVGNGSRGPAVAGEANIPSTGSYSLSSGTITVAGNLAVADGGGVGSFNQTGGDIVINTGEFWVANGTHPGGTDQPAVPASGSYTMSAGSLSVNNWVAIGRTGGSGTFDMTGGTITKTGAGNFIVGASGPATMTQSGGLVDVQGGITWIGEQNNATATLTLSDTAEFNTSTFSLGVQAGTNATLNLDGGIVRTSQFVGGAGTELVNFNGTQIIGTADSELFIDSLDTVTIDGGGLLVDTAGFNLTAPQELTGTGGVVKSGAGTLNLASDFNQFSGVNSVNAGTLVLGAGFSGTGEYGATTIADGAGLGVSVTFADDQATFPSVTFGTSAATSLDINLGNANTPAAAPLNVTGVLTLNGEVTVNIAHNFPELGTYPIINYGSKEGTGSFVLGELPLGVNANITDDNAGQVSLEITSIDRLVWDGDESGEWDFVTENWVLFGTTNSTAYSDGLPILFNDEFTGTSDVTLDVSVEPAGVEFANDFTNYTLTGSGSINGSAGLTKVNLGSVTIGTSNGFTGPVSLEGGSVIIDGLPDGGVASGIGAAGSAPENLNFAGGTLELTGAAGSTDRGFTVSGVDTGINNAADLTVSGTIQSDGGLDGARFVKTGAGDLILSGTEPNVIGDDPGTTDFIGFLMNGGDLRLQPGTNTTTNGQFRLANADASAVDLVLGDGAVLTSNGPLLTGQGLGSVFNMEINGTASVTAANRFQISLGDDSQANVEINDSGSLAVPGGWFSIGNSGTGEATLSVNDSGTLSANGDFNIGDVGQAVGTLNINDSAVVTSNGTLFVGKGGQNVGTLNLNSGTLNVNNWMPIGRFQGASGTVNVTGGVLNHTAQFIWVAEEGDGTLNISGTGEVVSAGTQVRLTQTETADRIIDATGTINLGDGTPGGTLTVNQIVEGDGVATGGVSIFNFNGGTLIPGAAANVTFMAGLDEANVLPGGAFIDTNGIDIVISQPLLDGGGGLTKLGAGTLTLSGLNTYTGTTTVSGGVLSMSNPVLADSSAVVIESGATLNLVHDQIDTVAALTIDGMVLEDGIYDAATHPGFISGDGQINVGEPLGTAYDTWATDNGLTPGVNDGPEFDADGDGISNVLEYVLGGDPLVSDTGILPEIGVDETTVTLTFNRSDDSETDTTQTFQWGTDLGTWIDVGIGATGSGPDANGVSVAVAENGADPDLITVTLPRSLAVDGSLFVRLMATKS